MCDNKSDRRNWMSSYPVAKCKNVEWIRNLFMFLSCSINIFFYIPSVALWKPIFNAPQPDGTGYNSNCYGDNKWLCVFNVHPVYFRRYWTICVRYEWIVFIWPNVPDSLCPCLCISHTSLGKWFAYRNMALARVCAYISSLTFSSLRPILYALTLTLNTHILARNPCLNFINRKAHY